MSDLIVSCIIPARNEAGNLAGTIKDALGISEIQEIIVVEGGSTDETWETACEIAEIEDKVKLFQQTGKGKFDAVKKGVSESNGRFVVIWDADGTVDPNDTAALIRLALERDRTTIGNRLKGNRHPGSMRTANLIGNYLFSILWAPFLQGKIHDLLCGSKVIRKSDFDGIPKWVSDYDPFGDFSLIASAIVKHRAPLFLPVSYFPRKYGETNIKRWRSGFQLIATSFVCFSWIVRSLRRQA